VGWTTAIRGCRGWLEVRPATSCGAWRDVLGAQRVVRSDGSSEGRGGMRIRDARGRAVGPQTPRPSGSGTVHWRAQRESGQNPRACAARLAEFNVAYTKMVGWLDVAADIDSRSSGEALPSRASRRPPGVRGYEEGGYLTESGAPAPPDLRHPAR